MITLIIHETNFANSKRVVMDDTYSKNVIIISHLILIFLVNKSLSTIATIVPNNCHTQTLGVIVL